MAKNKLFTKNKGQGMSMNVIIIAVISLIVLVVLLFIFNDKINIFGKGISTCNGECTNIKVDSISPTNSGFAQCDNKNAGSTGKKYTYNPSGSCPNKGACCIVAYTETQ